jgi:hypothetical protein
MIVFVVLSCGEIVGCVNLVLHECAGSVYFGSFRVPYFIFNYVHLVHNGIILILPAAD